jgi:hypothetical protein
LPCVKLLGDGEMKKTPSCNKQLRIVTYSNERLVSSCDVRSGSARPEIATVASCPALGLPSAELQDASLGSWRVFDDAREA